MLFCCAGELWQLPTAAGRRHAAPQHSRLGTALLPLQLAAACYRLCPRPTLALRWQVGKRTIIAQTQLTCSCKVELHCFAFNT